jgi:hypothetical protein
VGVGVSALERVVLGGVMKQWFSEIPPTLRPIIIIFALYMVYEIAKLFVTGGV